MVNRVLLGKHPNLNIEGMWISKPTKDALTSVNPDDYLFDPSKYLARPYARFQAQILDRGAFVYNRPYQDGSYDAMYRWSLTFYHGLGYVPLYTVQAGGDIGAPWCDANIIYADIADVSGVGQAVAPTYHYNSNGTIAYPYVGTQWRYDPPTNKMIAVGEKHSTMAVYRVPIA